MSKKKCPNDHWGMGSKYCPDCGEQLSESNGLAGLVGFVRRRVRGYRSEVATWKRKAAESKCEYDQKMCDGSVRSAEARLLKWEWWLEALEAEISQKKAAADCGVSLQDYTRAIVKIKEVISALTNVLGEDILAGDLASAIDLLSGASSS